MCKPCVSIIRAILRGIVMLKLALSVFVIIVFLILANVAAPFIASVAVEIVFTFLPIVLALSAIVFVVGYIGCFFDN